MRALLLVSIFGAICSGCARDWHYSAVNELRACRAWSRTDYGNLSQFHEDFRSGWKRGYFDVSTGKPGDCPVLPPKKYWGPHSQTPLGAEEIDAWYQGYQLGAIAAEQDGYGTRHALPARFCGGAPCGPGPFVSGVEVPVPSSSEIPSNTYREGRPAPPAEEVPAPQGSLSRRPLHFVKPRTNSPAKPDDAPPLAVSQAARSASSSRSDSLLSPAPGVAGGQEEANSSLPSSNKGETERTPAVVPTNFLTASPRAESEQP
jgi:hypothetical protein